MSDLNIKPTHKPIKIYYVKLEKYAQLGEESESTVRAVLQNLLQHYCHQSDFILSCEKMNKRSDIINDPNRVSEDPQYIVKLIGKVITVSLETVDIINNMPALDLKKPR